VLSTQLDLDDRVDGRWEVQREDNGNEEEDTDLSRSEDSDDRLEDYS
jgi:hypothetical protein